MYQLKKYKVARRLGAHLFEKTMGEKFAVRAERYLGKAGKKHGRGATDYGKQMLEKQRVRMLYGIRERQFANYVTKIITSHASDQSEKLYIALESRLDNVIYRLGFAPTRQAARQIVSHGHVRVNGHRTTSPSYATKKGDAISVRTGSKGKILFSTLAEKNKDYSFPSWLSADYGTLEGKILDIPKDPGTSLLDLAQVIEFYKR